jgi:hypothetical protein
VILALLLINVIIGIYLIVECRCYEPLFEEQPLLGRVGSAATLIFLVFAGPWILAGSYIVRGIRSLL